MIASLRGTVVEKGANDAIIDVNGVGYRVFLSLLSLARLPEQGQPAKVRVRSVIREDAFDLYGFLTAQEEELFMLLTSVSQVGPKLAMQILSGLELDALVQAIASGEVARLTKLRGVGKKTAERLVLELREKARLLAVGGKLEAASTTKRGGDEADVVSALVNLGFKPPEAERGVKLAVEELTSGAGFELLFREALKVLRAGRP